MTITEQLRAEQATEREAAAEAHRRHGAEQYSRYRTEGELERLAATDAARIAAERVLNDARREAKAAEQAVSELKQSDGLSLNWRSLQPSMMTPAARAFVERGRVALAAIEVARAALQKAIGEHNRAVAEVDAAAMARRRAQKIAAGELGTKAGA